MPPKQVRLELPTSHFMSVHLLNAVLGIKGVSRNHRGFQLIFWELQPL